METPFEPSEEPSEWPPAIGSPPCVFPVVHDGSRWFEMLVHVGFAVFLLALAHLANGYWVISGALLLGALYQAGKAACWVWRRSAERLEITSNEIVWHLGYARLRIPCDAIVDVTPVPGIRLTTQVTPDLLLRLSKTVHWKATPNAGRLWWLVWRTLPGSPDGAFVWGDMLVVQIAPESDRNFLDELHSRYPHLANSMTAASVESGHREMRECSSEALDAPQSVKKHWPCRRFKTVEVSLLYSGLGCLASGILGGGLLTLVALIFGQLLILVFCIGMIVFKLVSYIVHLEIQWIELRESKLVRTLGGAELCVAYDHIIRINRRKPPRQHRSDTVLFEIETICPVEWRPRGFAKWIWWLIRGRLPRPPEDTWNRIRDGWWFRKFDVCVRDAAEFERELARRCPVKVTATEQGAS
ncbi:MAG: hypothetical protein NT069_34615 [Planctomycetota bacterium]|nr:hypothetical protein [Planctomycetota bacterium]